MNTEEARFWIQIAVYVIGGFTFVGLNAFYVGQVVSKFATKDELKEARKDLEDKFVCKNVCKVLHEQADKTMDRLEKKVDEILNFLRKQ